MILYFSNIWIGIGIAVFVSILLIGIAMAIPGKQPTPVTFVICILLIPCASYQISRIYGALTLSDYIDTMVKSANFVSAGISSVMSGTKIMDNELSGVLSLVIPETNGVQDFISNMMTHGDELAASVNDYIDAYLLRRSLWLCLFIVITATGAFLSMNKETGFARRSRRTDSSNRPESRRRTHVRREHRG